MIGHLRALILLDRLSGQRVIRIQRLLMGPVRSSVVEFPSQGKVVRGHLYERVRGGGGPGIVMVHGFSPVGDGYDDLRSAAENLAASGFTVLTPTIDPLTHYLVNEEGMRMIGDATVWMAGRMRQPVTVIGISFSGGLVLVAAVQPEYGSSFRQVIDLSPYDDLRRIVTFYLTGREAAPGGGDVSGGYVNQFALDVTAIQFLPWLVPPGDVAPIAPVLQRSLRMRQFGIAMDPHMMDGLTEQQRKEAIDIIAARSDLQRRLTNALTERSTDLERLSPHGHMASLNVPVTLLSGVDDPAIPMLESVWLAQDLPPRTICEAYISPLIRHVALATPTKETGMARIRHWVYKLRLLHVLAPAMQAADPHRLFPGCRVK